jgi:hypothetical protein
MFVNNATLWQPHKTFFAIEARQWCQDTQHNNINPNDTLHNDIQHNDIAILHKVAMLSVVFY